jgi:hypothetical protein
VQGSTEKLQLNQHFSVIFRADKQTATVIDDKTRTFQQLPLKRVVATIQDPNYPLYLVFKGTGRTRKILGFRCRDYEGSGTRGSFLLTATACFSTEAPGSDDFGHLMKSMIRVWGKEGERLSFPAGVPLAIEWSVRVSPNFGPPDLSPQEAMRFKSAILKLQPQSTQMLVTRISSRKVAREALEPPASYTLQ